MLASIGLAACSTHRNHMEVEHHGRLPSEARITEPVFVEDHLHPPPPEPGAVDPADDPSFRTNTVVGNIRFGKEGYVVADTPDGQFNVSKSLTVTNREKYRTQVRDWLTDAFDRPLAPLDVTPPPPERRDQRGSRTRDGRDNISLPRGVWTPVPAPESAPKSPPKSEPSAPMVVPWVVGYTTHNAGWFFGQTYGTAGGARIHLLLVAYDADGEVLAWTDVNASRISERTFKPTGPELQDLLLKLERRVARKLR